MPLSVLLPMVVIGIIGIVIMLHLLGNSQPLVLNSEAEVRDIWHRQYPELEPSDYWFSDNRQQVLLTTSDGPGLIWATGADATCRLFKTPLECKQMVSGLSVKTGDFTAPVINIIMGDPAQQLLWKSTIEGKAT